MAKRTRKNSVDATLIVVLGIIGLIFVTIQKIFNTLGVAVSIAICIAIIWLLITYSKEKRKKRVEYLRSKYGEETIVQHILQRHVWEGQTSAQLSDSLGSPVSIDKKLLKTKSREIWKYNHRGANRYGLRITLDNDVVTGWEQKS